MFGYVTADLAELTEAQKARYNAVYCGICRAIRARSSNLARLGLSYDMAFLALLLMSLYEPEEDGGGNACILHPIHHRPWVNNPYIRYAADMNIALAHANALDDWRDDRHISARLTAHILQKSCPEIESIYPRQCKAIETCLARLSELERENTENPDLPAGCFGALMGELLVYREDRWSPVLRRMGDALGRFIYLADAAVDYPRDKRKKHYNPFLAMGTGYDFARWEQYLLLAMGRCTQNYEILPLVQDKPLLDNILYSGIWIELRASAQRAGGNADGRSL